MTKDVFIAGVGMTTFGRHDDSSMQDLAQAAVLTALGDASIDGTEMAKPLSATT